MKRIFLALGLAFSLSLGIFSVNIYAEEAIEQENSAPSITKQPTNFVGTSGSTATFSVTASNVSGYLWQYSADNGATWNSASSFSGYKTNKCSFTINTFRLGLVYRCQLKSSSGEITYTNTVYVKTSSSGTRATISAQPSNYKGSVGGTAKFSVTASNASSYQWQYSPDNGANWYLASSFTGYNTKSCSFTISSYRMSLLYRCKVISTDGSIVFSKSVYVYSTDGGSRATIKTHPSNYKGSIGDTASFSVVATNASGYVWQYSTDNGNSWNNATSFTGYKTSKCSFTVNNYRAGLIYRCKVISTDGSVLFSNSASIEVNLPGAVISSQPVNYEGAIGDPASFTVTASNVMSYQWQYSSDESNWYSASSFDGYDTKTVSFSVTSYRSKLSYRCKITGLDGKIIYTNTVKFVEGLPATITKQPTNYTGKLDETVTFTVKASNVVSYAWYYSSDGTNWYPASSLTGYNTDTLSFTGTSYRSKLQFKCKLTGSDKKEVYTNVVKYIAAIPATITKQPANCTGATGDTATFTVTADNATSYVWQYSSDGSNWYTASSLTGYNTNELSFTISSYRAGLSYRCAITGIDGKVVNSNVVKVVLLKPATITKQPSTFYGLDSDTVTFTVTADNATSYLWQYSSDGENWYTASSFTGYKTNTISFEMTSYRRSLTYRCKLVGEDSKEVYTNVVKCILKANIITQPEDVKVMDGSTATFKVVAKGDGLTYKWEVSEDNGTTWKAAGSTTSTLQVVANTNLVNNLYRCTVKDKYNNSCVSETVKLIVLIDKNPDEDETELLNEKASDEIKEEKASDEIKEEKEVDVIVEETVEEKEQDLTEEIIEQE